MKIPTDFDLLSAVYEQAIPRLPQFDREAPDRSSKIMVPLDIVAIAKKLNVDPDIVFGRLYFDLEKRHGYERAHGQVVSFFAIKAGGDSNCINVPLLSSVLAELQEQKRKASLSLKISIAAIAISLLGVGLTAGFRAYEILRPAAIPQQIPPPADPKK